MTVSPYQDCEGLMTRFCITSDELYTSITAWSMSFHTGGNYSHASQGLMPCGGFRTTGARAPGFYEVCPDLSKQRAADAAGKEKALKLEMEALKERHTAVSAMETEAVNTES